MAFLNGMSVQSELASTPVQDEDGFPHVLKNSDNFSLLRLRDLISKCVNKSSGETEIDVFLEMYREILKFMCSLGRLYAFAATDIKYKVNVISNLYRQDDINYRTVERMVEYECLGEKFKNNQDGTKTFLWLHRALEFVVSFIEAMRINILLLHQHRFDPDEIDIDISNDQRDMWIDKDTQEIVWDIYVKTLALHHGWIVKQLVHVASFASPSRDQILKIFGGDSTIVNRIWLRQLL